MANKEKQAVWLYPDTKELMTTHMAAANAKSQSDFIEKAIKFYAGYLDCRSDNMMEYLGATVAAVMDGIVKGSEQRISRALFKLAVESAMQSHIIAALNDVDEKTIDDLRGCASTTCARPTASSISKAPTDIRGRTEHGEDKNRNLCVRRSACGVR